MPTILQQDIIGFGGASIVKLSGKVKSIQRGVGSGASADYSGAATVTISEVNPSKCVVTITHGKSASGSSQIYGYAYLSSMTSTQLNILGAAHFTSTSPTGNPFSWQVVEYE